MSLLGWAAVSRKGPKSGIHDVTIGAEMKGYLAKLRADAMAQAVSVFNMVEWLKAGTEADRAALGQLAPRGWLISPSAPGGISQELVEQLKEDGIEAVEAGLMKDMDPSTCAEILTSLFDRLAFARWRQVLQKAMAAHAAGDYELAIPVWLVAIDGICREELAVEEVYSRTQAKRKAKQLATSLSWPVLDGGREPLGQALVQVIAGFGAPKAKSTPAVLNRHRVLHGEVPEIGNEKDSIQCILVLQVLHFCLGFTEERRKTPASPAGK